MNAQEINKFNKLLLFIRIKMITHVGSKREPILTIITK